MGLPDCVFCIETSRSIRCCGWLVMSKCLLWRWVERMGNCTWFRHLLRKSGWKLILFFEKFIKMGWTHGKFYMFQTSDNESKKVKQTVSLEYFFGWRRWRYWWRLWLLKGVDHVTLGDKCNWELIYIIIGCRIIDESSHSISDLVVIR